jgi:putative sigma-54 modulation protein
MEIQIQSIHFDADQKLLDFVEKKLSKLDTFYDRIEGADVYLKLDKNDSKENKVVEVKLLVPGHDVFVKEHAKTFEEAVDISLEVLKKQLKKVKDKLNN